MSYAAHQLQLPQPSFYIMMQKLLAAINCHITKTTFVCPYIISCGHTIEKSVLDNIIKSRHIMWPIIKSRHIVCPICNNQFDRKTIKLNKRLQNTVQSIMFTIPDIVHVHNGSVSASTSASASDTKFVNSIINRLKDAITCPITKQPFSDSLHVIQGCDHILEKKWSLQLFEGPIKLLAERGQLFKCPVAKCNGQFNLDTIYFDANLCEIVKAVQDVIVLMSCH